MMARGQRASDDANERAPMIHTKLLAVVLFLVLPAFSSASQAGSRSQDEHQKQLIQLEERWLGGEDNPDLQQSILADDFVHVLPGGFITKSEQINYLRQHPRQGPKVAKHFEDLHVRIYGSAGVVTGIVVATSQDGTVKKTLFTDVFAFRNGKWQAVNSQELPLAPASHK
jgi:hypothetical protein